MTQNEKLRQQTLLRRKCVDVCCYLFGECREDSQGALCEDVRQTDRHYSVGDSDQMLDKKSSP